MSTITAEQRAEKAAAYFKEGYNCAQAVILSFADELELDEKTLAKLGSSFGGGMGRLREVCGAVSGMFMVYGLLRGYHLPEEDEEKGDNYKDIQAIAGEFQNIHGSIVCRDILKKPEGKDQPLPEKRTAGYYEARPCERCVYDAATILENFLRK